MKNYLIDRMTINMETECWEWDLGLTHGYGRSKYQGKNYYMHRLSWIAFRGEIPEEKQVLHHCDNPKCINPKHLYIGIHQDNMDDMMLRGRHRTIPQYGNNYSGKKVMADNKIYPSYSAAGRALGISDSGVRKRIKLGWKGYNHIQM